MNLVDADPWAVALLLGAATAAAIAHFSVWRPRDPRAAPPGRGDVLLVTAHPDDETMFMVPTICALHAARRRVFLLCLSSGEAAASGASRAVELAGAAAALRLRATDVLIVDDTRLRDGLREAWDVNAVTDWVRRTLADMKTVGTVVTFDGGGVSGHANHVAVARGVTAFALGGAAVDVFELETVGLVRKFSGPLDALPSAAEFVASAACGAARRGCLRRRGASDIGGGGGGGGDGDFVVVTNTDPTAAHRAMAAHASQLLWYRRLFLVFSRYAYVNTLRRVA